SLGPVGRPGCAVLLDWVFARTVRHTVACGSFAGSGLGGALLVVRPAGIAHQTRSPDALRISMGLPAALWRGGSLGTGSAGTSNVGPRSANPPSGLPVVGHSRNRRMLIVRTFNASRAPDRLKSRPFTRGPALRARVQQHPLHRDVGGATGDQVGGQLAGAAGHGEAHVAVAGVEEEV